MKKIIWIFSLIMHGWYGHAQSVQEKLAKAVQQFEKDSQMRHAILGFAVMDAKTGDIVFERNSQTGLAPASTQKIVTSAAAFEILGHDYRYKTELAYDGVIRKDVLLGRLLIFGSGDPTLGSIRYSSTKHTELLREWAEAVNKIGVKRIEGWIVSVNNSFSTHGIPDGWIWQDIGNYYGAGAYQLNWKENQYDVILQSGDKVGDQVSVVKTDNQYFRTHHLNELKSAAKGTGDNAYIYLPVTPTGFMLLSGTIPVEEKSFSISGAYSDPALALQIDLQNELPSMKWGDASGTFRYNPGLLPDKKTLTTLHTHFSPPLDSINYWFMRRSINLYGEALIKTIGIEKAGSGSTDTGVRLVRDFWATKGIDKAAINIIDGSGLSPQNRLTPDALVQILSYAKARPWYKSFYESLPTYNGMKLKSGSIGGARSFAGYHTSAQGKEYIVAIIVNNYAGSSGEIVKKMYKVLDELK